MHPPKIFVSATSGDLRSARAIAKDALLTINCHPVEQTGFEPDWRTVEGMLRAKISGCQAMIHLVGFRYGAEPDPATLPPGTLRHSYTQMEYHVARELGLRVYTFLLPEGYPYDAHCIDDNADTPEKNQLQTEHRALIQSSPYRYDSPANEAELRTRIITLQEKVIGLEQEQQSIEQRVKTTRRWGVWVAAAVILMLGGIGVWQWQVKKYSTALAIVSAHYDVAAKMTQMQEALSRIQQQTDSVKAPISQWPQERLEQELARQMNIKIEDFRSLLKEGKTSLDVLIQGQALLASGKTDEAGTKFDQVLKQEQAALQRLQQAYEAKAQIAFDQVKYQEALDYRQKAAVLVDKAVAPLAWAKAQNEVSYILIYLARYRDAEPLMREIIRVVEMYQGQDRTDFARALNNLAQLLQDTNRLSEAESLMRQALQIDELSYGPSHPKVARDLCLLAQLLQVSNRLLEAEPLVMRSLMIDESSYGPDHADVARDLNNLATILKRTNRLQEAEPLMKRALTIFKKTYGVNNPNYAAALNNLAELLQAMNRLTEAESLIKEALKIDEFSFGPNHPNVARDLNNLALLFQNTNRLPEAEQLYRRAVQIDEISFGPDQPNVAIRLSNLATLLYNEKRLQEAEPLMQRVLQIDETSYGPDHPNVARDLNNLGLLYKDTSRLKEAEMLFRRALSIDEKYFGNDSDRVIVKTTNLALLLSEAGRLESAEEMGLSAARMVTLSKLRKNYSVSMQDSSKVREVYEHILEMRGRSKNEIASKVSELDVWAQNQLKKEGGKQ